MAKEKKHSKQRIRDIMTTDLVLVERRTPVRDAAQRMRDADVGDVLVTDDGSLCGIVTDRDIVIRCVAEDADPSQTEVGELCSDELISLDPEDSFEEAVQLMKEKAIRRLPVVEGERAIGIVSLGDLAMERDAGSALGRISSAAPNN